ncbi:uncharacterized protein TNCV_210391 [Trichonephila clavipes]|uniref:Uncharacterized protein n=1 Tax=Trichonephila clavipes TaxID=2585209 RepID=A0A8X6VIW6_TRICX|nr:uncharacterized protein TNCV_210391 [Trichonephila clavipes]
MRLILKEVLPRFLQFIIQIQTVYSLRWSKGLEGDKSGQRSCRCSGVKGSARKGRLDLRLAAEKCLEIVCGTIDTPTYARIVERVTVGSTSACRTIHQSSLLVVFLVAPDPVFRARFSRVHCSQQFITAHSERST